MTTNQQDQGLGASAPTEPTGLSPSVEPVSVSPLRALIPSVGDRFYCVPKDRRSNDKHWVIVQKVGRVWVSFSREGATWIAGRFDKNTLEIDGGNYTSRHRIYRTQADHEEAVRREEAWRGIRQAVDKAHHCPKWMSAVHLLQLARLLSPQGIETGTAKTEGLGPKDESPVAESDAPNTGAPL